MQSSKDALRLSRLYPGYLYATAGIKIVFEKHCEIVIDFY
jgi:hypothetical protein